MAADQAGTEDELGRIFNALSDGVIVLQADGTIEFINYAAQQLLGLDRSVLGAKVEDKIYMQLDGSAIEPRELPFYTVLRDRSTFTTDHYARRAFTIARGDRSILPVNMVVMPFTHGTVANGVTVVFHDQSSDDKIERAKSEFVALVSHQLRTPVNIISWYVEKLLNQRRGQLNADQMSYLHEVYDGNRRIIDLVQAIVNVSRTDLNKVKHKHEPVDLQVVAKRIIKELRPSMQLKNLHFQVKPEPGSYKLQDSDQELVAVVIRNVLTNAVRYTPDRGRVVFSTSHVAAGTLLDSYTGYAAPKAGIVVVVTDEGVGIPDEEKSYIFNKLFRGSNVQTLDVTGIGLGLYIAKSFITELGGYIWFNSEVRSGSTFAMYFPR